MIEILEALKPLLLVLLGSLTAILGGFFQFRISDKSRKNTLLSIKLERAYTLCQIIYDSHKREIANARIFLPHNPSAFIEKRNHPGLEMSELKMLIRAYTPDLKCHLENIDLGHNPLKSSFARIDKSVTEGRFGVTTNLSILRADPDSRNWDNHLAALSKGSFDLKKALEKKMSELV